MTGQQALDQADRSLSQMDAIAVTQGPGLMGSLLVGLSFAKGLALANGIQLVGVNHIDANMYANFVSLHPVYPFFCLSLSGGHYKLINSFAPLSINIPRRIQVQS